MFGPTTRIEFDGTGITLRGLRREDLPTLTEGFSRGGTLRYTNQRFGQTLENEQEWYDKTRKESTSVLWGIVPDGNDDRVIGTTGLSGVDLDGSCVSGIIIFEPSWHGKGIATRAHLARTLFAADQLSRFTIRSHVRTPNEASRRALERVGYFVTGTEPRTGYRNGQFLDTYTLAWLNPDRIDLLYPEGLPTEYANAVANARLALDKAREVVKLT